MINKFEDEFAFLSNFYNSPIPISDGVDIFTAKTVEHYFQASKTPNMEEFLDILAAKTPGQAKRLGRRCTLHNNWEKIKIPVMREALKLKFADPELKKKLIATHPHHLEEGNWWHDNFWGVCHCVNCQDIFAKNNLGKLLMELRDELMEEK